MEETAPKRVGGERYVQMLRRMVRGHGIDDVADRLGWEASRVTVVQRAPSGWRIDPAEAAEIAELHTKLFGPPPPRRRSDRGPRRTRTHGACVRSQETPDPDRVEWVAGGGVPWYQLDDATRAAVVAWLSSRVMPGGLGRGGTMSAQQCATRLGISKRTAQRWRAHALTT